MDIRVSKDGVSPQQLDYLRRAKHGPGYLFRGLSLLIDDDDVISGDEPVHPDWRELFNDNSATLENYGSSSEYTKIKSFVEKMSPLDGQLGGVDPGKLKLTFLLGAGASKPAPSNIPTVRELLPDLLGRAKRLDRDDLIKLADFCNRRGIDNVEDLLTAAHIARFCSRSPNVLGLLDFLLKKSDQDDYPPSPRRRGPETDASSIALLHETLQSLFGLLVSKMLPARPNSAHDAMLSYIESHPETAIVTTNYDCCVDLAISSRGHEPDYGLEFSNKQDRGNGSGPRTPLIKLHGSLNWFYCETCQEIQLTQFKSMVDAFTSDTAPYPVLALCKDCQGQRSSLLVPPLAMKFDLAAPLTPLLQRAQDAFEAANLIVVVGFSFADADVYISKMISKSMQTIQEQRVLIVDPDSAVVDRVRRKFDASIPDFDRSRILCIRGACDEYLPRFLQGELVREAADAQLGKTKRAPANHPGRRG